MAKQIRNSFDNETLKKIGRGMIIAAVGAILTYLSEALSGMDFGAYTPVVVAVLSILTNLVHEYRQGK